MDESCSMFGIALHHAATRPRVIPLAHNWRKMISIIHATFTLDRILRLVLIGGVAQVRHRTQKSACADSDVPYDKLAMHRVRKHNQYTTGSPVSVALFTQKSILKL